MLTHLYLLTGLRRRFSTGDLDEEVDDEYDLCLRCRLLPPPPPLPPFRFWLEMSPKMRHVSESESDSDEDVENCE